MSYRSMTLLWLALAAGCGGKTEETMRGGADDQGGMLPVGDGSGGAEDFGNGTGAPNTPQSPGMAEVVTDDGVCAASSVMAEEITIEEEVTTMEEVMVREPVALYIMLDQSSSMALGLPPPWQIAVDSLNAFVSDPDSEGIDVALQMFPSFTGTCSTGAGYDAPLVPLGRLPEHGTMISNALMTAPIGIGTPTEGALRGAVKYCDKFQAEHLEEQCVVVLVTDGKPTDNGGCSTDYAVISQIAKDAHDSDDVLTFTVGMAGADFTLLNSIAKNGGTDCEPETGNYACDVTTGGNKLVESLNLIRDTITTVETKVETVTRTEYKTLECEWELPPTPVGEVFDREKVNVQLSLPAGEAPALGKVASEAECQANAWYFDDPAEPTRILACPQTCDLIRSYEQPQIDILFGCATVVLE